MADSETMQGELMPWGGEPRQRVGVEELADQSMIPVGADAVEFIRGALARIRDTYALQRPLADREKILRAAEAVHGMARAAKELEVVEREAKRVVVEIKRDLGRSNPPKPPNDRGQGRGGQIMHMHVHDLFTRQQVAMQRKLAAVPDPVVDAVFALAAQERRTPSEQEIIRAGKMDGPERVDEDYVYPGPPFRVVVRGSDRRHWGDEDLLDACTSLAQALSTASYEWTQGAGRGWMVKLAEGSNVGVLAMVKGSVAVQMEIGANYLPGEGGAAGREIELDGEG